MADGSFYIAPAGVVDLRSRTHGKVVGFAGGGGSSVAVKMATGCDPDLAMNHWLTAVLAHQRHFPKTEHACADVFDVDPRAWRPGQRIAFGWFSPDCTDFSKAKGGAPRSDRIRGLAWSVIPWAAFRMIDCIMLENVEEFQDWGPVHRAPHPKAGEPVAERRGETFRLWRKRLAQLGYWVEWRVLNAADYGAPTTRKRLYLIARHVGVLKLQAIALGVIASPIVWPDRTHAPRKDAARLGLKPWRGACEIIDWNVDCPSIFLDADEVRELRERTGKRVQRPLVAATLSRVARGMERYVIGAADPFIVPITQKGWGGDRAHGGRDPLRTITSAKGGEFAACDATLAMITNAYGSNTRGGRGSPLDPTKTQVSAGHSLVVHVGLMSSVAHGKEARAWPVVDPARTQTGKHDKALVTGTLVGLAHGEHTRGAGARVRDLRDPTNTISAGGGDAALLTGCLVPRYGERPGQAPRAIDLRLPTPTIVPDGNGGGLASAYLVRQFGSATGGRDITRPHPTVMPGEGGVGGGKTQLISAFMAQGNFGMHGRPAGWPVTTLTTRSTQQQLVSLNLDTYYGSGSVGSSGADPLRVATGKARHSLVATWMEQANTGRVGHEAAEPVSTIMAGGGRGAVVQRLIEARLEQDGGPIGRRDKVLAFLWAHFGLPTEAEWAEPAGTLESRKKFGLVMLPIFAAGAVVAPDGAPDPTRHETWMIVDIGLRMLLPKELAAAMGLPAEYNLEVDANGRPISKTHQTQMIGNMVSPPPAAALIAANCPDLIETPEAREAA